MELEQAEMEDNRSRAYGSCHVLPCAAQGLVLSCCVDVEADFVERSDSLV